MTMRQRESLIDRIRHLRRIAAAADTRAPVSQPQPVGAPERNPGTASGAGDELDPSVVPGLEARVAHLERLVEGLQDSVHREALRQGKRIADIEAKIEPSTLGAALSKDARERGL